ncbi:MAG: triose-phosphate isomerase [Bacteroidetes bacterium]|nr:triose-phosphate isomerase [Bacteroidota bacterium]
MRTKIVAGNWKMNNNFDESIDLANKIERRLKNLGKHNTRVFVAPAFVNLKGVIDGLQSANIEVVAQNMHQADSGAFTGEISVSMLKNIGIKTVILGHSERRSYFNETDEALAEKINTVLENKMEAVFCFGEVLADRKSGNHYNVVESQIKKALFQINDADWSQIILAYEPVWAIGTGETASPEQAQEMHAFVRQLIADRYSETIADEVSILYGGSVKPGNAKEIFSKQTLSGFSFDTELLYIARKKKFKIKEIEAIVLKEHMNKKSKVNLLLDHLKMFLDLFKIRLNDFNKKYE